jgi:hypothetical protein
VKASLVRIFDPWQQIADWKRAILYLETLPEVDPKRIGLWGTSYAGGHALVLDATDRRLKKATVSQVPTISGFEQLQRRIPPDSVAKFDEALNEDERAQFSGASLKIQLIVSADMSVPTCCRSKDAIDFYLQDIPKGIWENKITVISIRKAKMYEPGNWVYRFSPIALLMVVGTDDILTLPGFWRLMHITEPWSQRIWC